MDVEKQSLLGNYKCITVALFTLHAMRVCWIILSSTDCLDLPYFTTSSHHRHDSPKI